jgi:hypothetical protein
MSLNNELNNYVNMYNNNIAQINNLYYNNAILQNNIYLIRQRMTQIPPLPQRPPIRAEQREQRNQRHSNNTNANPSRPPTRRRHRNIISTPHSSTIMNSTYVSQVPLPPPSQRQQQQQPTQPSQRQQQQQPTQPQPQPQPSQPQPSQPQPQPSQPQPQPTQPPQPQPTQPPTQPTQPQPPTQPPTQPTQPTQPQRQQPRRRPTAFTQSFFDPVIIYPTQRQVENATRIIQFDTITNPTNETCPFTCEPFHNQELVRQILHCGHIFTPSQFNTWFYSNVSCPICRYDIRTYQPQTIINNEELIQTTRENNEVQPILTETSSESETTQLVNDYLDLLFSSILQPNTDNSSSNSNRLFIEYIIREM